MRASILRHKVLIEAPVSVKQPNGSVKVEWQPYASVWANIEALRAFEKAQANAVWPGAEYKITLRFLSGLLPTMRVNYNGMIYSILGQPNNVEMRNRWIEITAQAGVKGQ